MFTNSFALVITGSRGLSDYKLFAQKVDHLLENVEQWDIHIITTDENGVPEMARRYAEDNGFELHTFSPMWNVHGKTAGSICNASMFTFLIQNFQHPACFLMGQPQDTKYASSLAKRYDLPLRVFNPGKKVEVAPKEPEKPEYVSAPKIFQDNPETSYDKFLIKAEAAKRRNDEAIELHSETNPDDYEELTPRQKKIRRKKLLARAAFLADLYGIWATPSWYEEYKE